MGNFLSWFATPFTSILSGIKEIWVNKQNIAAKEKERADTLAELQFQAKSEAIKRGDLIQADYDTEALKASETSYIDEIMVLWVLAIVTLLFIPATAPTALAGFAALSQAPVWFQTIVVGCFIAKLGLRFLFSGRTLFGKKL